MNVQSHTFEVPKSYAQIQEAEKIMHAKIAPLMPENAKAFLVAELMEDRSDPMTDYFGTTVKRTVLLAWSHTTRNNFKEMRKAAKNFEETAHMADLPESAEHRQNYSMGAGYFLAERSGYSGWCIRKYRLSGEGVKSVPLAEISLPIEDTQTKPAKPMDGQAITCAIRIEQHTHTKKGFVMHMVLLEERQGDFKDLVAQARELGGWYSRKWGDVPGGFAFKDEAKALEFKAVLEGSQTPSSAPTQKTRPCKAEKFEKLADAMQKTIDHKLADRETNTPRKQRMAQSARNEGTHLKRAQIALRKLADAYKAGNVPEALQSLNTKTEIIELTKTRIERSGQYYDAGFDTGEPSNSCAASIAIFELLAQSQSEEEAAQREALNLQGDIEKAKFLGVGGFFPTPAPVVEQMMEHVNISPIDEGKGFSFLEPEAGTGNVADAISTTYPKADLCLYEIAPSLRSILERKGYELVGSDFLESSTESAFDFVLMNPPFENGQDIEHVQHAFKMLKTGGRLIAIVSPSAFFKSTAKCKHFQEWFYDNGGEKHDLPSGSFKESGTGVETCLIVMDKG